MAIVEFIVGSDSVVLTDYGHVVDGQRGNLAPAVTLETRRVGTQLVATDYRHERRPIDLPFLFKAASETTLLANIRTMLALLASGEGILRYTRRDGVVREARRCYYRAGLGEKGRLLAAETVLSFDALDPYWYDPTDQEETFVLSASSGSFFPILPIRLSASAVLQEKTINNPGEATWPIWTIAGPGSLVSIENKTTGRVFQYSGTLLSTDVLVIDTRPQYKTVTLNGSNGWTGMSLVAADLWPLEPGDNIVNVSMGSATVLSSVEMVYPLRYISL